jgi:methionyl aminopeptidase
MIRPKNKSERQAMRTAGKYLAEILELLQQQVKPGMTTKDIDDIAVAELKKRGARATFLGYSGFPASICTSINEAMIHGIPSLDQVLKEGDVVSLDFGVTYKGMIADAARTFTLGPVEEEVQLLIDRVKESFFKGIAVLAPGVDLAEYGRAVDEYVSQFPYGLIESFAGHGIGKQLHEEPLVPNYATENYLTLKEHMTFALEPMLSLGSAQVVEADDGWTIFSEDYAMTAHYENTVIITSNGVEILTQV